MTMRPYVVRQGDYLTGLADRHGFDPKQVWEDQRNAELRAERPSPEVLAPGDIVFLPEHPPREHKINELEPLLPERAEFEISFSIGTDVFLLRDLDTEDLKPEKLDEILTPLNKFAEFAMTKVSILHLAPEFKSKTSLN